MQPVDAHWFYSPRFNEIGRQLCKKHREKTLVARSDKRRYVARKRPAPERIIPQRGHDDII
jgi:hypothetical protein